MNANGIGKRLLDFCQSSGLSITNSFFKHKEIHMYSWENPGQNRKSLLDYVIVEEDLRKLVLDTRVYRSFGLDSDHYLVASKLRIAKGVQGNYRKPTNRVKVEKLKDENVVREFISKLEDKFAQVGMNEATDIEYEWRQFKSAILEVAKECCGTYVCKNESGRKKSEWWNDEIRVAVKEKRVRWLRWLQNRNDENLELYREQKRVVKVLVKEARERERLDEI